MKFYAHRLALAFAVTTLLACGGGEVPGDSQPAPAPAAGSDLTPFQLEHGIGPITEPVTLGPVDPEMAEQGKEVFELKCSACHKTTERYIGPELGGVTARRSPAFIMNMILNPQEMIDRHPVTKQLLAEYMSFMANQNLTQQEARQVLEYLRTQATGTSQ
ncbi:MAG: c-type cytochrome [Gemmatimonadota bacterium]